MSDSNYQPSAEALERENKIKEFLTHLSIVQNVCETGTGYFRFHDLLDPRIRALMIVNGAFMVLASSKIAAKSFLDWEYQELKQPPNSVQEAFAKAKGDIDKLSVTIETSMKEILTVLQSQTGITPITPATGSGAASGTGCTASKHS